MKKYKVGVVPLGKDYKHTHIAYLRDLDFHASRSDCIVVEVEARSGAEAKKKAIKMVKEAREK